MQHPAAAGLLCHAVVGRIANHDGDRVAVEWWVTEMNGGEAATLAGIFLLTFEGDKVGDLREAFVKQPGKHEPHEGWGE